MFSFERTSTVGSRALGALRLARSFLLLEDDYEVDWEVGQDERMTVGADHPHRAPLRGRRTFRRRPGQPMPAAHVCLCPIERSGPLPARSLGERQKRQGWSPDGSAAAPDRSETAVER